MAGVVYTMGKTVSVAFVVWCIRGLSTMKPVVFPHDVRHQAEIKNKLYMANTKPSHGIQNITITYVKGPQAIAN